LENRKCKRLPARLGCWLVGDDEAVCCGTFEISETGVSVRCSDPPAAGRTVRLQFYTPLSAGAVTVEAEVVWSTLEPEEAMGLRFLDMDDGTMHVLRELMRQQKKKLP
jgi:PilZ domain